MDAPNRIQQQRDDRTGFGGMGSRDTYLFPVNIIRLQMPPLFATPYDAPLRSQPKLLRRSVEVGSAIYCKMSTHRPLPRLLIADSGSSNVAHPRGLLRRRTASARSEATPTGHVLTII